MGTVLLKHKLEAVENPCTGDIICFKRFRGLYYHFGVADGNGYVYHLTGDSHVLCGLGHVEVKKEPLDFVAGKAKTYRCNAGDSKHSPQTVEKIIGLAEMYIGTELKYGAVSYNCETFAYMLRYGEGKSRQATGLCCCLRLLQRFRIKNKTHQHFQQRVKDAPQLLCECWGPFRETKTGKKYIFTVTDADKIWEAIPITSKTMKVVATHIDKVLSKYDVKNVYLYGQTQKFTYQVNSKVCKRRKESKNNTRVYYAGSKIKAKHETKRSERKLRKHVNKMKSNWDDNLAELGHGLLCDHSKGFMMLSTNVKSSYTQRHCDLNWVDSGNETNEHVSSVNRTIVTEHHTDSPTEHNGIGSGNHRNNIVELNKVGSKQGENISIECRTNKCKPYQNRSRSNNETSLCQYDTDITKPKEVVSKTHRRQTTMQTRRQTREDDIAKSKHKYNARRRASNCNVRLISHKNKNTGFEAQQLKCKDNDRFRIESYCEKTPIFDNDTDDSSYKGHGLTINRPTPIFDNDTDDSSYKGHGLTINRPTPIFDNDTDDSSYKGHGLTINRPTFRPEANDFIDDSDGHMSRANKQPSTESFGNSSRKENNRHERGQGHRMSRANSFERVDKPSSEKHTPEFENNSGFVQDDMCIKKRANKQPNTESFGNSSRKENNECGEGHRMSKKSEMCISRANSFEGVDKSSNEEHTPEFKNNSGSVQDDMCIKKRQRSKTFDVNSAQTESTLPISGIEASIKMNIIISSEQFPVESITTVLTLGNAKRRQRKCERSKRPIEGTAESKSRTNIRKQIFESSNVRDKNTLQLHCAEKSATKDTLSNAFITLENDEKSERGKDFYKSNLVNTISSENRNISTEQESITHSNPFEPSSKNNTSTYTLGLGLYQSGFLQDQENGHATSKSNISKETYKLSNEKAEISQCKDDDLRKVSEIKCSIKIEDKTLQATEQKTGEHSNTCIGKQDRKMYENKSSEPEKPEHFLVHSKTNVNWNSSTEQDVGRRRPDMEGSKSSSNEDTTDISDGETLKYKEHTCNGRSDKMHIQYDDLSSEEEHSKRDHENRRSNNISCKETPDESIPPETSIYIRSFTAERPNEVENSEITGMRSQKTNQLMENKHKKESNETKIYQHESFPSDAFEGNENNFNSTNVLSSERSPCLLRNVGLHETEYSTVNIVDTFLSMKRRTNRKEDKVLIIPSYYTLMWFSGHTWCSLMTEISFENITHTILPIFDDGQWSLLVVYMKIHAVMVYTFSPDVDKTKYFNIWLDFMEKRNQKCEEKLYKWELWDCSRQEEEYTNNSGLLVMMIAQAILDDAPVQTLREKYRMKYRDYVDTFIQENTNNIKIY